MFPTLHATSHVLDQTVRTAHTITLPAGGAAGDVDIVAWAWAANTAVDTPAGWTWGAVAAAPFISGFRFRWMWRRRAAGDAASVTINTTATCTATGIAQLWKDVSPASSPATIAGTTRTPANVSSGAVAMPTPGWALDDTAWITLASWTPLAAVPSVTSLWTARGTQVGDGAAQRQDMAWRLLRAATIASPTWTQPTTATEWMLFGLALRGREDPVTASFTWAQSAPGSNTVVFQSTSTGPVASASWEFGQPPLGTATGDNPSYTFPGPGDYDVKLTVTGSESGNTSTVTHTITVEPPEPPAEPPALSITIAGEDVVCELVRGDWEVGRPDWYARLEPSTATIELLGDVAAASGDTLVVATQYGPLWTGRVEGTRTTKDTDGVFRSVITARDLLAEYGQAELGGASVPAGNIKSKMDWLAAFDGHAFTAVIGPAQGTLPNMDAETGLDINALEAVQCWEDNSNAAVFLMPDGSWVIQHRSSLPTSTVLDPIPLVGPDCPWEWIRVRSTDLVINDWIVKRSNGTVVMDWTDTASVAAYGRHTFPIDRALHALWPAAPTPGQTVAAQPRWTVEAGRFDVRDADQLCYQLKPLDFVELEGELWQILAVRHEVGIGTWSMTVVADQSQNSMGGIPDPPVEPTEGVTISGRSTKDAQVVLNPSNVEMGAGKGDQLAIGYYQGYRYRALAGWPDLNFPAGTVGIIKATLEVETTGQIQVAFGSNPKVIVRAITQNWPNEGSYVGNDYRNAVIWPGPTSSGSGSVSKAFPETERVKVQVDITDIVASMLGNPERTLGRGVIIHSANENSAGATTEILSREAGAGNSGPLLTIKCKVDPGPGRRPTGGVLYREEGEP